MANRLDADINIGRIAFVKKTQRAIARAINNAGIQAVADARGVSIKTVYAWRAGTRAMPASAAPDVEMLSLGLVRCEEMHPDVNWAYLRGTR